MNTHTTYQTHHSATDKATAAAGTRASTSDTTPVQRHRSWLRPALLGTLAISLSAIWMYERNHNTLSQALSNHFPPLTLTLVRAEDGSYATQTSLIRHRMLGEIAEKYSDKSRKLSHEKTGNLEETIESIVDARSTSTEIPIRAHSEEFVAALGHTTQSDTQTDALSDHLVDPQLVDPQADIFPIQVADNFLPLENQKQLKLDSDLPAAEALSTDSWTFESQIDPSTTASDALNFYHFTSAGMLDTWRKIISPAPPSNSLARGERARKTPSDRALLFGKQQPALHTIVLDPGHGGSDPGTIGHNGLFEKELTLDIARRVKELARHNPDINVLLSRNDDDGLTRTARLNNIKKAKPDLLLSLHFNNLPEQELSLVETFYAGEENILESHLKNPQAAISKALQAMRVGDQMTGPSMISEQAKRSRQIATIVQRHMYETVRAHNDAVIDNGIKKDTLFILTRSGVPGALIEISCLSHPAEEDRLRSDAYRAELAETLMRAIADYFNQQDTARAV